MTTSRALFRDQQRERSPSPQVATSDLPLGEVIPGSRYRVLSRIGVGGMGVVYGAEHVDLQKRVALKVLAAGLASSPEKVESFRHEARTASKIGSPYICDVTDFGGLADGRVYFVMEYLEGESLGRLLRQDGHLPAVRVLPILRQIAKALGATHEKGVIHLDVKPDNVVVVRQGRREGFVKMVDFGIAALLEERRFGERVISGTPEYVAPERILGREYDHRADVYSLGVVAYELLTGRHPFHGRDYVATLTMQVKDPPIPFSRFAPQLEIPPALEKVVLKLLEKDPAGRPENMAAVEALLCEAQIASGIVTPWDDLELPLVEETWRNSLAERMPRPGSRKRKVITVSALGAAALGAVLAIYFGAIRKPEVIIKQVRLEITKTEEAPEVAAWLVKAGEAVRRQRYTKPVGEAALDFIENAEGEAGRLGRSSPGAGILRSSNAANLVNMGDELVRVGLPELAVLKYREAVAFLPNDPVVRAKAQLEAGELRGLADGSAASRQARRRAAETSRTREDQLRDLAGDVFALARAGRVSEARRTVKLLSDGDGDGQQRAVLADGLRKLAEQAWGKGQIDEARPLYEIVAGLDPGDLRSARRAETIARPEAQAAAPEPVAAPVAPAVVHEPSPRRPVVAPVPDPDHVQRDPAASQTASRDGQAAMDGARIGEAEAAFNRAVKLDPLNSAAVGGLAAVAFERARYPEALDYARRAAALAPRAPRFQVMIGDAYFKLLRYREALAAYQRAQALHAEQATIKNRMERVAAKLK